MLTEILKILPPHLDTVKGYSDLELNHWRHYIWKADISPELKEQYSNHLRDYAKAHVSAAPATVQKIKTTGDYLVTESISTVYQEHGGLFLRQMLHWSTSRRVPHTSKYVIPKERIKYVVNAIKNPNKSVEGVAYLNRYNHAYRDFNLFIGCRHKFPNAKYVSLLNENWINVTSQNYNEVLRNLIEYNIIISDEVKELIHQLGLADKARYDLYQKALELYNPGEESLNGKKDRWKQPDQIRWALQRCSRRKGVLWSDQMGLGKTRQALRFAEMVKRCDPEVEVIVVCGAKIRNQWLQEAQGIPVKISTVSWSKLAVNPSSDKYIVIIDECHRSQNSKSNRSQDLLALCDKAMSVVAMSGTPAPNGKPEEMYVTLKCIGFTDKYASEFIELYPATTYGRTKLNEDMQVADIKRGYCISDIKPKANVVIVEHQCTITDQHKKIYTEKLDELMANHDNRVLADLISDGFRHFVELQAIRQANSLAKVQSTVDLICELVEDGHKPVVFGEFIEPIQQIIAQLHNNVKCGWFKSGDKNSDKVKQAFINGEYDVFIATLDTGGEGVDGLQTVSDVVILHDQTWVPGKVSQAIQRVDRVRANGEFVPVTAYFMQGFPVDNIVLNTLRTKDEYIGELL